MQATTGRGLGLVADLADHWGCEATSDGKVVWFTVLPDATAAGGRETHESLCGSDG